MNLNTTGEERNNSFFFDYALLFPRQMSMYFFPWFSWILISRSFRVHSRTTTELILREWWNMKALKFNPLFSVSLSMAAVHSFSLDGSFYFIHFERKLSCLKRELFNFRFVLCTNTWNVFYLDICRWYYI